MPPNPDESGWRNILAFASTCGFTSLITTALAGLDAHLQPIEKLLLGDRLGIPALTRQGLREVCTRAAPPTFNEGRELGLGNVICVAILREKTQCYKPNKAAALTDVILEEILAQRATPTAPVPPEVVSLTANGSARSGTGGVAGGSGRAAGVAASGAASSAATGATTNTTSAGGAGTFGSATGGAGLNETATATTSGTGPRGGNRATTGAAGGTARVGQGAS